MEKLKPIDRKILFELMKNSHRSDRQLAKAVGVSQPTVTRRRGILEKEFIQNYTLVPIFEKVGFELVALTFVKSALKHANAEEKAKAKVKGRDWIMRQKCVIFALSGQGLGHDGCTISFHKSYSDYIDFIKKMKTEASDLITESESFIAPVSQEAIVKRLDFKCLAEAE